MAVSDGAINGVTNISKSFQMIGAREAWLLTVDFPESYTGSGDTTLISAVCATITARARDGKTRTLRGGIPVFAGKDTNSQVLYSTGGSVQAMTVSSDTLAGQLSAADGTEATTATASTGLGIIVICDVA